LNVLKTKLFQGILHYGYAAEAHHIFNIEFQRSPFFVTIGLTGKFLKAMMKDGLIVILSLLSHNRTSIVPLPYLNAVI
jgi:hypothetical protein